MSSICVFGVFVADLCFFADKIPIKGETVLGKNHIVGPVSYTHLTLPTINWV